MATGPLKKRSLRLGGVPVFVYHGLTDAEDFEISRRDRKYWVPSSHFKTQLDIINKDSRRSFLLRDLWNNRRTNTADPSVVLTFDDGHTSDYEIAFPLLKEAGIRADFFINPANIGKPGFLTWPQIWEMHRFGMSFQSHGYDHVELSRLPIHQLEHQIRDSKFTLEDHLGSSVDFIAVPYGFVNNRVVNVALQEGYRAVCTPRPWPAEPGAKTLGRLAIYRHTSPNQYRRLLAKSSMACGTRALRSAAIYIPKGLLLHYRPKTLGVSVFEEKA